MASPSATKSILKPKSNLADKLNIGVGELIKSVSFDVSNIESTRSSNFKATDSHQTRNEAKN